MKNLEASIQEYLIIRRSLGYKLKGTESYLYEFADFLMKRKRHTISTALALEWIAQPQGRSHTSRAQRLSVVRLFAEFRKITDPKTEVPPKYLLPCRPRRAVPHIYSDEELGQLLEAFLAAPTTELRRCTRYTIFGLLTVTGCRVGEILGLAVGDVNLRKGFLTIRNAKFGKSRIIPIHPTTAQALKRYVRIRNFYLGSTPLKRFFVSQFGNPVDAGDLKRLFVKISKEIGLRRAEAHHGPRLHDLRHSFAVRTILTWYRNEVDVDANMPLLSTYLGHIKPSDTYWYLTGVPELLSLAATRLEATRR